MFYIRFKEDGDMIFAKTLYNNIADYVNVIKACDDVWIRDIPYRINGISFQPARLAEEVDCVDVMVNR